MSSKRGGLGRGLGAIFGDQVPDVARVQPKDIVQEIFVSAVQPNRYQPRKEFNMDALKELAESIKVYGVLQPIIVRKLGIDSYELIAGERRLRAAKILGLEKIPAIIRDYTDAQTSEISIIENVQRQDLNAIEEAQAYDRLIRDFGHTQEELAEKIGCSRSHIANMLRLLKLSPKVREFITIGLLTMGQARPLLAIEDEFLQLKAAQLIVAEDLPVRKVEAFLNEIKNAGLIPVKQDKISVAKVEIPKKIIPEKPVEKIDVPKKIVPEKPVDNVIEKKVIEKVSTENKSDYVKDVENKLTEIVGAQVKIISDKSKKQIQINFSDREELIQIIKKLENIITNSDEKILVTKEDKISALRKFSTKGIL